MLFKDLGELWLGIRLSVNTWLDRHRVTPINAQAWCLFVGYPRSGHSLVSSIIDAHPHAAISHRLDALRHVQQGVPVDVVSAMMLQNSRRFAQGGRRLTRYAYELPGQGPSGMLHLIGDQEGRGTTEVLRQGTAVLDGIPFPVKFIHVIRNPYDNISSWARRTKRSLPTTIERYFSLCNAVASVRQQLNLHEIYHEEFVANPAEHIQSLCAFLGLEVTDRFVANASALVNVAPHKSRYEVLWTHSLIDEVKRKIVSFEYLHPYSCEG